MVDQKTRIKWDFNISKWDSSRINFWGITKSGNTSIKKALIKKQNPDIQSSDPSDQWVHSFDYAEYITREEALQNGYYNFTVVRDPYQRFLSMYKDSLIRPHIYNMRIENQQQLIAHVCSKPDEQLNMHLRSQSYFVGYEDCIDFYKLEEIGDVSPMGLEVEHTNAISGKIEFEDGVKEMVETRYRQDFEMFGYDYD